MPKFQSLSGFLMVATRAHASSGSSPKASFQSLSGFLMVATDDYADDLEAALSFNPYRVF